MERRAHWERVYSTRGEQDVSWFEATPAVSTEMLDDVGLTPATCVLDVGGGESRLVDHLLGRGLTCIAVLDVSGAALDRARRRLGQVASVVRWIEADVTGAWDTPPVDIWHDRAVLHFLTTAEDRERYRTHLLSTLKPGGTAVIATFALDGPETCSGLPVMRYSPRLLAEELGADFRLVDSRSWRHTTPQGAIQSFQYSRLERLR
jgi:SAM-dependent methyltransferase